MALAPDVDGEVALGYQARIWMFLFEAGDVEFAEAVDGEPAAIRAAVARFIDQLLQSHPELIYPRTRASLMQPPTSNQAMQRTAGRFAITFSMIPTPLVFAACALARGR